MMTFLHILLVAAIIAVCLFAVTFAIYFFNLDMKMTAALSSFFEKHYDKVKRDRHL